MVRKVGQPHSISVQFNYFKSIYSAGSPVIISEDDKCQFFPYQSGFTALKEVFNMSEKDANMEGKPWYIGR